MIKRLLDGQCHNPSFRGYAPIQLALAGGWAVWAYDGTCAHHPNTTCWPLASADLSTGQIRTVDHESETPPLLAGDGRMVAYFRPRLLGAPPALRQQVVKRFHVGRLHALFPVRTSPTRSDVEGLTVGGGLVETAGWRVLSTGDGCGCLQAPAWSPDGRRIAYLDSPGRIPSGSFGLAVAVMNADGSGGHDITSPTATRDGGSGAVWSPDGTKIAYVDDFPDEGHIWVVNADGSGGKELAPGYDPSWSPDGTKIAFTVNPTCNSASSGAVMVMNADGTNRHQLANVVCPFAEPPVLRSVSGLAWSPDGSRIALSVGSPIWKAPIEVMNADGSNLHKLGGAFGDEPSWSPDSGQIVFHRCDHNNVYASLFGCVQGLSVIGADGSGLHDLTTGPDMSPSWSPDGTKILFASWRNLPPLPGTFAYSYRPELYEIDPNGKSLHPLTFTRPADVVSEVAIHNGAGRLRSTFEVHGAPYLCGVGLTGSVAAVCSENPEGQRRIAVSDPRTGRQRTNKIVTGCNTLVGADNHWLVCENGTRITALQLPSLKVVPLGSTAGMPLDLTVSGRRVAWAENINGHGRIRALELPN